MSTKKDALGRISSDSFYTNISLPVFAVLRQSLNKKEDKNEEIS